jgi:hypothetical protein
MKTIKPKKNPLVLFLPLIFCLLTFLTGCVRYDVGINFDHAHKGSIVQHIKIGEQLSSLSQAEAKQWLNSIEDRVHQLRGKVTKINAQEVIVTIPFGNGKELAKKFNQFFYTNEVSSESVPTPTSENLDLVKLNSLLTLKQSNLVFLERVYLNLTVDLRALGVLSNQGKIIISPGSLIALEFQLNTPLFARSLTGENLLNPVTNPQGKQLTWQLQPGQVNNIEAIIWLPSPIGIGSLIIVLLFFGGFYLKYKRLPGVQPLGNN